MPLQPTAELHVGPICENAIMSPFFLPLGKRSWHLYLSPADTLHIPALNYFLCLCDGEVKENDKSEGVNMKFIRCINGSCLWKTFGG